MRKEFKYRPLPILYANEECFPGYNSLGEYNIRRKNYAVQVSNCFKVDCFGRLLTTDGLQKEFFNVPEFAIFEQLIDFSPSWVGSKTLQNALIKKQVTSVNYPNLIHTLVNLLRNRLRRVDGELDRNLQTRRTRYHTYYRWSYSE